MSKRHLCFIEVLLEGRSLIPCHESGRYNVNGGAKAWQKQCYHRSSYELYGAARPDLLVWLDKAPPDVVQHIFL